MHWALLPASRNSLREDNNNGSNLSQLFYADTCDTRRQPQSFSGPVSNSLIYFGVPKPFSFTFLCLFNLRQLFLPHTYLYFVINNYTPKKVVD